MIQKTTLWVYFTYDAKLLKENNLIERVDLIEKNLLLYYLVVRGSFLTLANPRSRRKTEEGEGEARWGEGETPPFFLAFFASPTHSSFTPTTPDGPDTANTCTHCVPIRTNVHSPPLPHPQRIHCQSKYGTRFITWFLQSISLAHNTVARTRSVLSREENG